MLESDGSLGKYPLQSNSRLVSQADNGLEGFMLGR
jgi:hypothetical protein